MTQRQTKSARRAWKALLACALAIPLYAQAAPSLYLGLGGGVADNKDLDDTDTAIKALVGFNFNETFGVEGSYIDFGETNRGAFRSEADTVAVHGIVNLPFNPRFGLFAKGGAHFANVTTSGPGFSRSEDETDATYGAGAKFEFTDYLGARAEWERYEMENRDTDVVSASLIFKFQ